MTEEKDLLDVDDLEDLEASSPEADMDEDVEAHDDETESSGRLAELFQSVEPKSGDIPLDELEKLRPICTLAEQNYQAVQEVIKKIRSANVVLHKFHTREGDITPRDVDAAKEQFDEAKKSYIQYGRQINEGIRAVYGAAKTYPEDLLVQNLYIAYLAKLLASLEARNPVENYVRQLADGMFSFDREDIILTEEERRRDLTVEGKKKDLLEQAARHVARLEARYQKRQLHIKLRQGERPLTVLKQLVRVSKIDPEDIHTFIWVAKLMSKEIGRIRDQNKRLEMRDDILAYCQRAFTQMDDFLNLQGIQNLSERDKRRSEYLKTITQIRKPLVDGR